MSNPINLQSSVSQLGKVVTQIIHFSGGNKKTFKGLLPETIEEGSLTKIRFVDGNRMLMVNPKNVDCIEVFAEIVIKPVK